MKKTMSRFLSLALALLLALSLAACGGEEPQSSAPASQSTSQAEESSSEAEEPSSEAQEPSSQAEEPSSEPAAEESSQESAEGEAAGFTKFATVEEYVNSPELQEQLSAMTEALGDTVQLEVTGEAEKLIYHYQYPEGTATEGLAAALEEAMAPQEATFSSIASSLKLVVDVEDPVVEVVYADSQGNVIYSQEFHAE